MASSDARPSFPVLLQCLLAAGVLSVPFLAQTLAYLLYLYPRSAWLWFLSVGLNRDAAPLLEIFGSAVPLHPLAGCAVLAGFCVAPLVFYMKRNWLGISAFGHLALFVALLPIGIAIVEWEHHSQSASLAGITDFTSPNINAGLWFLAVAALLPLCVLNHVTFLRSRNRPIAE